MRHIESQVLHEETASEQGSMVGGPTEVGRRAMVPPHAGASNADGSPMYSFNLSFEELSGVGLDEAPRHGNVQWTVGDALEPSWRVTSVASCLTVLSPSVLRAALTGPPA